MFADTFKKSKSKTQSRKPEFNLRRMEPTYFNFPHLFEHRAIAHNFCQFFFKYAHVSGDIADDRALLATTMFVLSVNWQVVLVGSLYHEW